MQESIKMENLRKEAIDIEWKQQIL